MLMRSIGARFYRIPFPGNKYYVLSVIANNSILTISLKLDLLFIYYESSFNLENLCSINKRFRGFDSVEEVLEDILYMIDSQSFVIGKTEEKVIFSYLLGKEEIKIPISLIKDYHKNLLHKGGYNHKLLSQNSTLDSNNLIQSNISFLNIHQEFVINQKLPTIRCLCLLRDGNFACCSGDETIKIFNSTDYTCEFSINTRHKYGIMYVALLDDDCLISASADSTMKVWKKVSTDKKNNLDDCEKPNYTYQSVATLRGHCGCVWKVVQLSGNRICSCSSDETLKIWRSVWPYECIATLSGHEGFVFSFLELNNRKHIVSVCILDKTLRFWNNSTYECEHVIDGVHCWFPNSFVELENDKLIIGGIREIIIVNSNNAKVERVIYVTNAGVILSIISLNNGLILLGNVQGEILVIDTSKVEDEIFLCKKKVHEKPVNFLMLLNQSTLITCSSDYSMKVWK